MAQRAPHAGPRASLVLLSIATCCVAAGGTAVAGDEDLSPNAYQEFDPVTGFMVTVDDPDAQNGHGDDTAAQVEPDGAPVAEGATGDSESSRIAWLYWVIVGIAAVGVVAWLRKKATTLGD